MSNFLFGSRNNQPNKLGSIQVQTSEYGTVIPVVCGQNRIGMKLLDYFNFSTKAVSEGGKGGSATGYEYYAAIIALLCEGPISGIGNILDSSGASTLTQVEESLTLASTSHTVSHSGIAFYYDNGVYYGSSYSVVANDYGSDGSMTLAGTQQVAFEAVPSAPAAGQYSVSNTGVYTFNSADIGKAITIVYSYSTDTTQTDEMGDTIVSPAQTLNLSILLGTRPQAAWGYAIHPLHYAGRAYIADEKMDLGSDATVPDYTFEILNGLGLAYGGGVADCNPASLIARILGDPYFGLNFGWVDAFANYSAYCVANGIFLSPVYDSSAQMSSVLKDLLEVTNAERFWSEGKIKIVPYGDTTAVGNGVTFTPPTEPIVDVGPDDYLVSDKSGSDEAVEPLTADWPQLTDNYNWLTLEYQDRAYNYNTCKVSRQDDASIALIGLRPEKTLSAHAITENSTAAFVCDTLLRRLSCPMRIWKFKLSAWAAILEPMDIITLTSPQHGIVRLPVRIQRMEEDDNLDISFTCEDFVWGTGQASEYGTEPPGGPGSGGYAAPGQISPLIVFEANARLSKSGNYEMWLGIAGANAAWGGARVWMSTDGVNYKQIGVQSGATRCGWLTANMASGSDPDTTNSAGVQMFDTTDQLTSGTSSDADNYYTLCWLNGELFSYETATLTAPGAYTLGTYLRRGIFGTSIASHVGGALGTGEPFMRLDDEVFVYEFDPTLIGKTVYFKCTSWNLYQQAEVALEDAVAYPYTVTGAFAVNANTANNMALSSIVGGGGTTATIEVYNGNTGVGTSGQITKADGTVINVPAASVTGYAFATTYYINWSPAKNSYVVYTTYTAEQLGLTYGEIVIGALTTVNSGGTGGDPGGGDPGGGPPGGGDGCTAEGTPLLSNLGYKSNVLLHALWESGEVIELMNANGRFTRIKSAKWMSVPATQLVEVEGFTPYRCSASHPAYLEGFADDEDYIATVNLQVGAHIRTTAGFKHAVTTHISGRSKVWAVELDGPDHTYQVVEGVITHNKRFNL